MQSRIIKRIVIVIVVLLVNVMILTFGEIQAKESPSFVELEYIRTVAETEVRIKLPVVPAALSGAGAYGYVVWKRRKRRTTYERRNRP